jgi:8-oxo-dGTP pyrophosphatase MutT (NUDIX family)
MGANRTDGGGQKPGREPESASTAYPAATVMVVRDGDAGIETLLLERRRGGSFSGAFVFPGGRVDESDAALYGLCDGMSDRQASQELAVESDGLAYRVAAVREVFEESGILLTSSSGDKVASNLVDRVAAHRMDVARGRLPFGDLCRREGMRIDASGLFYVSFWITPEFLKYRFSTRFFVAALPPGQDAAHDGDETVSSEWVLPAYALSEEGRDRYRLKMPTISNLGQIAGFDTVSELLAVLSRRDRETIEPILPVRVNDEAGERMIIPQRPDHPSWPPSS